MLESVRTHHSVHLRNRTIALFLRAVAFLVSGIATAQGRTDVDAAGRIRDAALNHSQIMDTIGYLAEVTGPRLTGSANLKRAEEYHRDKFRGWGLANAHLEPWGPFGCGWSLGGFTANLLSPGFSPLIAYPKAWRPGTNGTVSGEAVFLDVKTASDLDRHVDPLFDRPAQRRTDEESLVLARLNRFNSRRNSARRKILTTANGS